MYTYAVKVDLGIHESQNDDRALIGSILLTDGELSGKIDKDCLMAAVCDGVGGMAQGYRAAMTTLEMFSHLNNQNVSNMDIQNAIEEANRRVRNIQSIENLHNGLRTTIAGFYSNGEKFIVYNAGDSRVYRFRFKYLMQLSKDHSLVQDLIDMGEITAEEARNHPEKNVINKCIGNDESVNPRIIDMDGDYSKGDILFLCSDGVCDVVTDNEIKDIISEHKADDDLNQCCNLIYDKAIKNGSLDNITVILVRKD